jgi:argininosuccinate lyase
MPYDNSQLTNALTEELERINREMSRLEGERAVVTRLLRRADGGGNAALVTSTNKRTRLNHDDRQTLTEAVVQAVTEAGDGGDRARTIIDRVQLRTPYKTASIKTAMYQLRSKGYLVLEGHVWKAAYPVNGKVT